MMCFVARKVSWDDLIKVRFETPIASLPFATEPVPSVDELVTVPGIEAFLNTSDNEVRGVWWATDLPALRRVLHARVAEDSGVHDLDPPTELLPRGADRFGTFGSVSQSLRSQGLTVGATGAYTFPSGQWNYRELTTGNAGFSYMYRQRSGDNDPVAVISISLARVDWVPSRRALRRGPSGLPRFAALPALLAKKPRIDPGRRAWGESLRRAGLWSGLPESAQMVFVTRLSEGEPVTSTLEEAGWPADGEDLAEGLVGTLLKSMSRALSQRGVRLRVKTIHDPHAPRSPGYTIEINGKRLDLYPMSADEPSVPLSEDPWLDSTILPLHRINELLAEAGSGDRVVVFEPGGNDGFAILTSPEVLELLLAAPSPRERPLIP